MGPPFIIAAVVLAIVGGWGYAAASLALGLLMTVHGWSGHGRPRDDR